MDAQKNIQEDIFHLSELIGLIYDGATDPARWSADILPALCKYFDSRSCVAFTPFNLGREGGFAFFHGMSQAHYDLYATRYYAEDIHAQAALAKGLTYEGCVATDTDLMPHQQLLDSLYYKEYLSRENMARLMNTVVFGQNSAGGVPVAVCSFWRGLEDPPYDDSDRQRLKLLAPHISRSIGVMYRLRAAELKAALSQEALNRLVFGVLLLDALGYVTFANRAARRMLDEQDGLRLRYASNKSILGSLVAEQPALNNAICDAISNTVVRDAYATPHFSSSITVPRVSGPGCFNLQFSALGHHGVIDPSGCVGAGIVFINDSATQLQIDPNLLQTAYGLTQAESRVAVQLVSTGSAQEVADKLGVSVNTVRSQIKQIYLKLGVDTRTDFVKLMIALGSQIVSS